jgi:hypothetical protein
MSDQRESGAAVVSFVRGEPRVAHSDEVRQLAFVLWATVGGRPPAAVERLLAQELPDGVPLPTQQAIGSWARADDWAALADGYWRANHRDILQRLQLLTAANFYLSQVNKHEIQTGAYAGREAEAAVLLKAGELSDRLMERGVVPLLPPVPEERPDDDAGLSRQEREAKILERMAQRKRARD